MVRYISFPLLASLVILCSCGKKDTVVSNADSLAIDRIASDKLLVYQALAESEKKSTLTDGLVLAMTDPDIAASVKAAVASASKQAANAPKMKKKDALDKADETITKADSTVTKTGRVVDKTSDVVKKTDEIFKK
jgi:hypothetical protein